MEFSTCKLDFDFVPTSEDTYLHFELDLSSRRLASTYICEPSYPESPLLPSLRFVSTISSDNPVEELRVAQVACCILVVDKRAFQEMTESYNNGNSFRVKRVGRVGGGGVCKRRETVWSKEWGKGKRKAHRHIPQVLVRGDGHILEFLSLLRAKQNERVSRLRGYTSNFGSGDLQRQQRRKTSRQMLYRGSCESRRERVWGYFHAARYALS